mmetsp:Transcript_7914/g.17359  ORF Transcript_7914/g.17359 Transcript_7914/m.17359 type:complete len:94 (+) Transcript_7914:3-284(+)
MLQKRGDGRLASWNPRWFALLGHELAYYEKPPLACTPLLCVNVERGEVRLNEALLQFAFAVGDGSLVTLRAPSRSVFDEWLHAITHLGIRLAS